MIQSASLRPGGIFTKETLAEALDAMRASPSAGEILRIKGFVRSDTGSLSVNYTVGGRSVVPCASVHPMLNVIGRRLDRKQIKQALDAVMLPG